MTSVGKSGDKPQESPLTEQVGIAILDVQFETLLNEVQTTLNQVKELMKSPENSRLGKLVETLVEFARFSRDYFDIFRKRKVPNQNHLQEVLDKIQREWLNLRPLVEQRCYPNLAEWLKIADVIADDCLMTNNKPCFTFFEKTNHMACFAYSRVPGIALPLANLDSPWLWLGLGHEIGHYLYWNYRQTDMPSLKESLAQSLIRELWRKLFIESYQTTPSEEEYSRRIEQLSVWYSWIEEIFADIYGALIFGPAYISSLMAWLRLRVKPETVLANDNDHSLPLLRPLIQIQAIQELNSNLDSNLDDKIKEVEQGWRDYWGNLAPDQVGFDYWLEQPVGQSRVQDYIRLIHVVAKIVVATIVRLKIIPLEKSYNVQIHKQVTEAATNLQDNIQLLIDRPALALVVAWYAAEGVTSEVSKGPYRDQLKVINQWVKTSVAKKLSQDKQPEDQKFEILTGSDWLDKLEPSTSFGQRLADIMVDLAKGQEMETTIDSQLGLKKKSFEQNKLLKEFTDRSKLDKFLDSLEETPNLGITNKITRGQFQGAPEEFEDDFWKYLAEAQSQFTLVDRVIYHLLEGEFSILINEFPPYVYGASVYGGYTGHSHGGFGPNPYPYGPNSWFPSHIRTAAGYGPSFQPTYRSGMYQPQIYYRPTRYQPYIWYP